jgi:hypothetical protein
MSNGVPAYSHIVVVVEENAYISHILRPDQRPRCDGCTSRGLQSPLPSSNLVETLRHLSPRLEAWLRPVRPPVDRDNKE